MSRNVLGMFVLATTLAALGQTEQPSAKVLTLAVPRTVSSAPILALEGVVVANHRLDVQIYDDHPLALAEFLSGQSQVLFTGYQLGLGRWQADRGVRHLATVVWGVSSLLVTDPALQGLNSLAGKKVLVPFAGSPLEVQLKTLLKSANLLDRVLIEYSPITQMPALLLQGKADAIAVPEPIVSRLISQGQARTLFSFAGEWGRLTGDPRSPQVSLFVKSKDLDQNPELYRQLRNLIKQKAEGVFRDADIDLISRKLELSPELVLKAMGNTLFSVPDHSTQLQLLQTYHTRIGDGYDTEAEFLVP